MGRGRGAVHVTSSSPACLQRRSVPRVQLVAEPQRLTRRVTPWSQRTSRICFPPFTQDPCQHVAVVRPAPWRRPSHGTTRGRSLIRPSGAPTPSQRHAALTLSNLSASPQRSNAKPREVESAAAPGIVSVAPTTAHNGYPEPSTMPTLPHGNDEFWSIKTVCRSTDTSRAISFRHAVASVLAGSRGWRQRYYPGCRAGLVPARLREFPAQLKGSAAFSASGDARFVTNDGW
jgi:hypothetical protein